MLFLEGAARLLLVLHAILGAATIAVATHLVLWTRKALRGQGRRLAGLRWFGAVLFGLFALQFAVGNLVYPTYKVRVRGELFDLPHAALDDLRVRAAARAELLAREGRAEASAPAEATEEPPQLPRVARLFDVKEHLVALGLFASLGLYWLSRRSSPEQGEARVLYVGLAGFACAVTWAGAVIGLYTASIRAIGSLG